jgi:hypothetical protein
MATVTNRLTRINDAEGTITTANIPSGGAGAGANTDIFLQGAQSLGRRQTTTGAAAGFVLVDDADNNVSAASVHVGFWFWVTQYAILDDVRLVFGTGTGTPANHDIHFFPYTTEYPNLGGWVRAWVDVSRTPDVTGGTGLNESQLRSYGIQVSFTTTPGGTSPNLIIDSADYTDGGHALELTGTSGVWLDFATSDENTTNQYGVFRRVGGVYNCFARVQLGTNASSLVFSDSNKTIVFPQQALVEDTFMGINCNLGNASTDIDIITTVFSSAGSKQGDFVVSGTSGSLLIDGCSFNSIRIVTLTSATTLTNSVFNLSGPVTQSGANISTCTFNSSTGTTALIANDLDLVDDCTFISDGTGHAVELTTLGDGTMEWRNNLTGYAGSNGSTGNEALYVNVASGSITINVAAGYSTPSVRTAGATVTVVAGAVTVQARAVTSAGAPIQNARVILKASDGTGPYPFEESVTITRSGSTATVTHTGHGLSTNDYVAIDGADQPEYNGVKLITVTGANSYTYTVSGTPATPATGTIESTFVALYGLTDSNGVVSTSRVYSADQPVIGWTRKSTSSPYYKEGTLIGTISSATGFNSTAVMVSDE